MKKHATQRCHQNILQSQQNFQPKNEKTVSQIKQLGAETFVASEGMVQCFSDIVYTIKTQESTVLDFFYFAQLDILVTLELRDCKLPFLWIYKQFRSPQRGASKNINMKPSIQNLQLSENCCGLGLNQLNFEKILIDQVDDLLFIKTDQIYCLQLTQSEITVQYKLKTKIDDDMQCLRLFKQEDVFYCIMGAASNIYVCKITKISSNIVEFVLLDEAEKKLTCSDLNTVIIQQRAVQHDFGTFSKEDLGLSLLGIVGCTHAYNLKISLRGASSFIFVASERALRVLEVTSQGLLDVGYFQLFHKGRIMALHLCSNYLIIQADLDGIFLYFYLIPDRTPIRPICPYSRVLSESGLYFYEQLLQELESAFLSRQRLMAVPPPFATEPIVANLSSYLQQIQLMQVFVFNLTPETAPQKLLLAADGSCFSYLLQIDDLVITKSIALQSVQETILGLNECVQALEAQEERACDLLDMKVHALGQIVMYGCLFRENQKIGNDAILPQLFCNLVENALLLTKSDKESSYLCCQLGLSKFGGFPAVPDGCQSTVGVQNAHLVQYLALAPVKLGTLLCLYNRPIYEALGLASPFDFEGFDAVLQLICNAQYRLKKSSEINVTQLDFRRARQVIQSGLVTVYAGNLSEAARGYQVVQSLYICIITLIQTVLYYGQTRIRICGDVLSTLSLIDSFLNCSFAQCINLVFFELCNHQISDMKEFVTETTVDKLREAMGILIQKAKKYEPEIQAKAAYINVCLSIAIQAIDCRKNIQLGDTELLITKNKIQIIEILQRQLIRPIKSSVNSMYFIILRFFCQQYFELVVEAVVLDIKLNAQKITLENYVQPFYQQESLHQVILVSLIQINNQNVQIDNLQQQLLLALARVECKTLDIVDRTLSLRSDSVRAELERLHLNHGDQFIMNQFIDDQEVFAPIYSEFNVLDGYIQCYFDFTKNGNEEALLKMWKTSKYLTALIFAKKINQDLCIKLFGDEKDNFVLVLQMMDNLSGIQSPFVKYIQ